MRDRRSSSILLLFLLIFVGPRTYADPCILFMADLMDFPGTSFTPDETLYHSGAQYFLQAKTPPTPAGEAAKGSYQNLAAEMLSRGISPAALSALLDGNLEALQPTGTAGRDNLKPQISDIAAVMTSHGLSDQSLVGGQFSFIELYSAMLRMHLSEHRRRQILEIPVENWTDTWEFELSSFPNNTVYSVLLDSVDFGEVELARFLMLHKGLRFVSIGELRETKKPGVAAAGEDALARLVRHSAATSNSLPMTEFLLQQGLPANLSAASKAAYTAMPLYGTIQSNGFVVHSIEKSRFDAERMRLLLRYGANPVWNGHFNLLAGRVEVFQILAEEDYPAKPDFIRSLEEDGKPDGALSMIFYSTSDVVNERRVTDVVIAKLAMVAKISQRALNSPAFVEFVLQLRNAQGKGEIGFLSDKLELNIQQVINYLARDLGVEGFQ